MESGKAASQAVYAAVQRGLEQVRHNGTRRTDINQGAVRSNFGLSEILSRGHLRVLRDEHRRHQHPGLHNVISS